MSADHSNVNISLPDFLLSYFKLFKKWKDVKQSGISNRAFIKLFQPAKITLSESPRPTDVIFFPLSQSPMHYPNTHIPPPILQLPKLHKIPQSHCRPHQIETHNTVDNTSTNMKKTSHLTTQILQIMRELVVSSPLQLVQLHKQKHVLPQ